MTDLFYEQRLMNNPLREIDDLEDYARMYNIHDWQSIYDYFYKVSRETYGDSEEYAKAYAKGQADLYYIAE